MEVRKTAGATTRRRSHEPGPRRPANPSTWPGPNAYQGSPTSRQKVENGRTRVPVVALPKFFVPRCTW